MFVVHVATAVVAVAFCGIVMFWFSLSSVRFVCCFVHVASSMVAAAVYGVGVGTLVWCVEIVYFIFSYMLHPYAW